MLLNEYITTKQAAKMSGYTPTHIAFLIRSEKIRGWRFGRAWMVQLQSLDDYMNQIEHEEDRRYGPKKKI